MVWLAMIAALALTPAHADSWAAAKVTEVFSASREHFVRVVPGESIGDTFGFAGAKKGRYARADFYLRQPDRSYRLIAEAPLLNPVAPTDFFVSDGGHLATLDNWHNVGYGVVLAVYDAHGRVLRSYRLADLFTPAEIERFPHSVSSIHWRQGPTYVRQDQKTLLVTVRSGVDFLIDLETGERRR
jgi:hypothetical protein